MITFPARKLGAFLRGLADPEGHGLPSELERDISEIERRVAAATTRGGFRMTWEDLVRENEGPELDEARQRLRGDDCPGCGAPAGCPPAGPCNNHGSAVAFATNQEHPGQET